MAKKRQAQKVRKMWVACSTGPWLTKVYWARGGLAVTESMDGGWCITVTANGWATGTQRWDDPKEAVRVAKVVVGVIDWRGVTFDWLVRNAKAIRRRIERALRGAS